MVYVNFEGSFHENISTSFKNPSVVYMGNFEFLILIDLVHVGNFQFQIFIDLVLVSKMFIYAKPCLWLEFITLTPFCQNNNFGCNFPPQIWFFHLYLQQKNIWGPCLTHKVSFAFVVSFRTVSLHILKNFKVIKFKTRYKSFRAP